MEADYLQSNYPEPVVLLGQRLEPFTLGHAKILLRFRNRYASGIYPWTIAKLEPSLDDLVFGIFVCCQTHDDAIGSLRAGYTAPLTTLDKYLQRQPRRLSYQEVIASWSKSLGSFDLTQKSNEFYSYVLNGSLFPELHREEGEGRAPGSPLIQRVEIVLINRIGYTREQAINCPWGQAVQDYFAFWEMEGTAKIMTEKEKEEEEWRNKAAIEYAKENVNGA